MIRPVGVTRTTALGAWLLQSARYGHPGAEEDGVLEGAGGNAAVQHRGDQEPAGRVPFPGGRGGQKDREPLGGREEPGGAGDAPGSAGELPVVDFVL